MNSINLSLNIAQFLSLLALNLIGLITFLRWTIRLIKWAHKPAQPPAPEPIKSLRLDERSVAWDQGSLTINQHQDDNREHEHVYPITYINLSRDLTWTGAGSWASGDKAGDFDFEWQPEICGEAVEPRRGRATLRTIEGKRVWEVNFY